MIIRLGYYNSYIKGFKQRSMTVSVKVKKRNPRPNAHPSINSASGIVSIPITQCLLMQSKRRMCNKQAK